MLLQGEHPQRHHHIADASAIGEARRDSQRLARLARFDDEHAGQLAVVVTELASNLLRHAGGGVLQMQAIATAGGVQVETLAIDRGPGMADVARCVADGYSTRGTAGNGLGAVRRLSSTFDVHSDGRGCVVLSRIGGGETPAFGAVCTAIRGEVVSGDGWRLAMRDAEAALIVVDGLGHGPLAADAAAAALEAFCSAPFDEPGAVIDRAHRRLTGTRGAAGACARRLADGRVAFAGIGNVAARAIGPSRSRGLVSHNGTLGLQVRRVQQFEYECAGQDLLVLHSDGLSARWDLDAHAGLRQRHPAVIAAVLHRDHARERDDATVVVMGHA